MEELEDNQNLTNTNQEGLLKHQNDINNICATNNEEILIQQSKSNSQMINFIHKLSEQLNVPYSENPDEFAKFILNKFSKNKINDKELSPIINSTDQKSSIDLNKYISIDELASTFLLSGSYDSKTIIPAIQSKFDNSHLKAQIEQFKQYMNEMNDKFSKTDLNKDEITNILNENNILKAQCQELKNQLISAENPKISKHFNHSSGETEIPKKFEQIIQAKEDEYKHQLIDMQHAFMLDYKKVQKKVKNLNQELNDAYQTLSQKDEQIKGLTFELENIQVSIDDFANTFNQKVSNSSLLALNLLEDQIESQKNEISEAALFRKKIKGILLKQQLLISALENELYKRPVIKISVPVDNSSQIILNSILQIMQNYSFSDLNVINEILKDNSKQPGDIIVSAFQKIIEMINHPKVDYLPIHSLLTFISKGGSKCALFPHTIENNEEMQLQIQKEIDEITYFLRNLSSDLHTSERESQSYFMALCQMDDVKSKLSYDFNNLDCDKLLELLHETTAAALVIRSFAEAQTQKLTLLMEQKESIQALSTQNVIEVPIIKSEFISQQTQTISCIPNHNYTSTQTNSHEHLIIEKNKDACLHFKSISVLHDSKEDETKKVLEINSSLNKEIHEKDDKLKEMANEMKRIASNFKEQKIKLQSENRKMRENFGAFLHEYQIELNRLETKRRKAEKDAKKAWESLKSSNEREKRFRSETTDQKESFLRMEAELNERIQQLERANSNLQLQNRILSEKINTSIEKITEDSNDPNDIIRLFSEKQSIDYESRHRHFLLSICQRFPQYINFNKPITDETVYHLLDMLTQKSHQ